MSNPQTDASPPGYADTRQGLPAHALKVAEEFCAELDRELDAKRLAKNARTAPPLSRDPAELDAMIECVDPLILQAKPIPERRWLVPGLIPWGSVTLLGGDGGMGKSLLMLQLQVAAAIGRPWIGQSVTPVKSFGFYCEDDTDELHRRLADINQFYDVEFVDIAGAIFSPRVGLNNIIAQVGHDGTIRALPLYDALLEKCLAHGAQLLVVDTIADTFGGNENFRSEVRTFIALMRRLAMEIDGAVLLTAHPSQAGLNTGTGISGSTAWHNSVRSRLYLRRPPTADQSAEPLATERLLRTMKANYSGLTGDIGLTWQCGVFVAEEKPQGVFKGIADRKAERVFLDGVNAATRQGRAMSEHSRASNFAPKMISTMPEADGVSVRDLECAMVRLFNAGGIKVGCPIIGPDRHKRRGIVAVTTPQESCGKVRDGGA